MDLIDRQAAIDTFKDCAENGVGIDGIVYALEELPPARPERIKGHWIDAVIPNDNGGLPVQVCDQCNTFFPFR